MRILKGVLLFGLLLAVGLSQSTPALAAPMLDVQITYIEKAIDGGLWEYDYTVLNKSDIGVDVWEIFFPLDAPALLTSASVPEGWEVTPDPDLIKNPTVFVQTLSSSSDYDIPSGTALSGFVFQFDIRVGDLSFDVTTTEWDTSSNGFYTFSGTTTAVPEPATILLLAAGIGGLGFARRRRLMSL